MKTVLVIFALIFVVCRSQDFEVESPTPTPTIPGFIDIIIGFTGEFYKNFNVTSGQTCLNNIDPIVLSIEKIIIMIVNGTYDPFKIYQILKDLLPAILNEVKSCKSLLEIGPVLADYFKKIEKDPSSYFKGLGLNVLNEFTRLFPDINKLSIFYSAKQFTQFGLYLSDMVCRVFIVYL